MTQPAAPSHIEYIASGVAAAFTYPFKIASTAELEVRLNSVLNSEYSVSGVGNDGGGTVTFYSLPPAGTVVSLRLLPLFEQTLDLLPSGALPAAALEGRLDQIVKMVQNLQEELSRRPALIVGTKGAHRDLEFPAGVPLGLIGWDATAAALTTSLSTIQQVVPSATSQLSYVQGTVAVAASSGAGTALLTASAFLPAGIIVLGVVAYVSVTCGNGNGLTTWQLGDADMAERWGRNIGRTATSASNVGQHVAYAPLPIASARDVLLVAEAGGLWDATGSIILTYSGFVITPATSV